MNRCCEGIPSHIANPPGLVIPKTVRLQQSTPAAARGWGPNVSFVNFLSLAARDGQLANKESTNAGLANTIQAPRQQLLCSESAEVSVHQLGTSLAAEMEHIFPDSPREDVFLAAITFQFPAEGADLAAGLASGTTSSQVGTGAPLAGEGYPQMFVLGSKSIPQQS